MITVVPDTNVLFDGEWLESVAGKRIVALAEVGSCVVLLPEVVVEELERQYFDKVDVASAKAKSGLRRIRNDIDTIAIDVAFSGLKQRIIEARQRLLARYGVALIKAPESIVRSLVRRDLERRRPFMETEQNRTVKSFGFRDAVIWETVLAVLRAGDAKGAIHFVTNDNGFIDKKASKLALHPHLLADLDALGIDRGRVILAQTLTNVVEQIHVARAEAEAKEAEAEAAAPTASQVILEAAADARAHATEAARRAALVRVTTAALEALVDEEITERLVHEGYYGLPDFVQFELPSAMESATIVAIDLESDFTFDAATGDTVTGSANVTLSIEGATFKGDLFGEDDAELQIIGELNNHYYETATSVRARAVISIDTEFGPDGFEVYDVTLDDDSHPASDEDPSTLQLDFDFGSETD